MGPMGLRHSSESPRVQRNTMSKNDFAPEGTRVRSPTLKKSTIHKKAPHSRNTSRGAPPKSDLPKHTIEETDAQNTFAAQAPPSLPGSPAPQRRVSVGVSRRLSSAGLAELLRSKGCDIIPETYDLHLLWSSSIDPPITKATLSELDLNKLFHSLYLRHDLNFDRDIHFSPRNNYGPVGKQKEIETQRYWDAIEIELALYNAYLESISLAQSDNLSDPRCSIPSPTSLKDVPLRLPDLIRAIRRIVETLVPPAKWPAVGAKLDASLFIQQLEHGQCDIEDLFNQVGNLLLKACAPSRDSRIEAMIVTISQGCRQQDSHILRRGLQDLFCILEIMKLDAANHQLQLLRDFMLTTSINFERSQTLWRLHNDWAVHDWLPKSIAPFTASTNPFALFTSKFVEMIVLFTELPTAFHLDHARIHRLQTTFQTLTFQQACCHALDSTLVSVGWTGKEVPESVQLAIASLITAIEQDLSLDVNQQREALVLGIASQAYKICGKQHEIPKPAILSHTAYTLQMAADTPSPVSKDIMSLLSEQLSQLVEAELEVAAGLDAVQLAYRYTAPAKTAILLASPNVGRKAGTGFQQRALLDMARKAAHVAVLHWRVWAPILYLRRTDHHGEGICDGA